MTEEMMSPDELASSLHEAMTERHGDGMELPRNDAGAPYLETLDQAEWAMRKLAAVHARRDEAAALYQAEKARLDAWLSELNEAFVSRSEWFEQLLEGFHRARLEADPTAKTVKLPSGSLSSRMSHRLEVNGTTEQLAEALAAVGADDIVAFEPKVTKSDLQKRLEWDDDGAGYAISEDGEKLPLGPVARRMSERRFTVQPTS